MLRDGFAADARETNGCRRVAAREAFLKVDQPAAFQLRQMHMKVPLGETREGEQVRKRRALAGRERAQNRKTRRFVNRLVERREAIKPQRASRHATASLMTPVCER